MRETFEMHEQDLNEAQTARADAALRALFAEAPRPAMGDERFTAGVMAAVDAAQARRRVRLDLATMGLAAAAAALVAARGGELMVALTDAFADAYAPQIAQMPSMSAAATALLAAAVATAAGWMVAERG